MVDVGAAPMPPTSQLDAMDDCHTPADAHWLYNTSGKLKQLEVAAISFRTLASLPEHALNALCKHPGDEILVTVSPDDDVIGFDSPDADVQVRRLCSSCCWQLLAFITRLQ